ncbi:ATP-binding cassette domain-containing protein [Microbispora hainanensis]|jgi:simple sugar transport system ATP-binding protein|uniref:ATP-binding cassette domain-containing protein n=1 Tax=Microbispora hainanensis TaxID=568844 RepID=A0ABZ1SY10_9ACTN|nr:MULTISPECIES: ATP-binding cassette domain-containing protein [Microbispora]NJP28852.1 sugar ABC transporter ATP-binding protein [Microbispora sp. CL1-1]
MTDQEAGRVDRVVMRDIRKRYGMVDALRGVTLRVGPGEVVGLVGDNAAGKSTLMKVLAGAVVPDSGEIVFDGRPVSFASPKDARELGIEMVYQDLALCDDIDVAGNLFLGREPRRAGGMMLDVRKMHADARRHLDALNIRIPLTDIPVGGLSGGQRQAVAIARAVTFGPKLLILDEPTAALAVAEVETVLELIKTVSAQDVSVILITHRLQDLFRVCDRLCVMYEGTLRADLDARSTSLERLVSEIVAHDEEDKEGRRR